MLGLTLCLVRLDMLLAIACSQSKQSSSAGNWMTPLQTPSTAMTWKAFFLRTRKQKDGKQDLATRALIAHSRGLKLLTVSSFQMLFYFLA